MNTHKTIKSDGIVETASATVRADADIRVNFVVKHLQSSAILCRKVGELENANLGKEYGDFWHEILANACGLLFTAVAALETYANEIFIDHKLNFPEYKIELMMKLWELYEQKAILDKFEFALILKNAAPLNRGDALFQNVSTIIRLRNTLMHFKPEWLGSQDEHAKLSKLLANRASPSPFFSESEPLFPRAWASHATAMWVIRSTLEFMLEFEQRVGIKPSMAKFKEQFVNL